MSTLRDYILDCRCPNCGVMMERKPPKKPPSLLRVVASVLITLAMFAMAMLQSFEGHWAEAAFYMALTVLLQSDERRPAS